MKSGDIRSFFTSLGTTKRAQTNEANEPAPSQTGQGKGKRVQKKSHDPDSAPPEKRKRKADTHQSQDSGILDPDSEEIKPSPLKIDDCSSEILVDVQLNGKDKTLDTIQLVPVSPSKKRDVNEEKEKRDVKEQKKRPRPNPKNIISSDDEEETTSTGKKRRQEASSPGPRTSASSEKKLIDIAKKSDTSTPKENGASTPNTKDVTSSKDNDDKKEQQRQNYQKYMSRGGPKNLGAKEFPEAEPNCLNDKAFLLTGVLESFERDDVANVIKNYGGRVVSGVSRKTDYLIVGDGAGESKLEKAKQLGIIQLTEDEFLNLLASFPPTKVKVDKTGQSNGTTAKQSQDSSEDDIKIPFTKSPSSSKSKSSSSSSSTIVQKEPTATVKSTPSTIPIQSKSVVTPASSLLWVDKYKPTSLRQVVGQNADGSNAKKLLKWLQNWYKYHGSSTDKAKAAQLGHKDPEGKTFKVALLSGPPGIGKTTTAVLCCKELGYSYTEMNASDTRNKSSLEGALSDALGNMTLNYSSGSNSTDNKVKKNHVIIMDEVDGMSGTQDRGGIAEVIMLLKKSRIPIICICNDRNAQKIRSLANYCFDLRFKQPSNEQLKGFVQQICFKEKVKLSKEIQQQLITSTDHDIRQILHQMHMFKSVESSDMRSYAAQKDLQFGPWDVTRKVFSAKEHIGMSLNDKAQLFFHDYQMGPLFVQENYLRCIPKAAHGNRFKTMDLVRSTAASLAIGDRVEVLIRKSANWSLLPIQGIFQSVLPGEYMEDQGGPRVDFPSWFGKNSNQGKQNRLLKQLHSHMHLNISGSLDALNMDYLPYLRRAIVKPLSETNIDEAVTYMMNYSLVREDLDAINDVALWPNMRDLLANLTSKSKAAFTRLVNKQSFVPYSVIKSVSKKGKGGDALDAFGLEEDAQSDENQEVSDQDEEDISLDPMIKAKKKLTTKSVKKK